MFKRMAIMGAGAMGTLLGAILNANGVHIDLIDVDRAHVEALKKNGATAEGTVDYKNIPVTAYTPDEMSGVYDLIFLMVKQTYNESALKSVAEHIDENSVICTTQNGLPELTLAERFGEDRVVGAAVTWAATMKCPGVTIRTSSDAASHSTIGRIDGKVTDKVREIAQLLGNAGAVKIADNLMGIRWSKLLINSAFSGTSAAFGCTFGGLVSNDDALHCAEEVARECIRSAEACGYRLEPLSPGEDYKKILFPENGEETDADAYFRGLFSGTMNGKSSILQDVERKRPSEIDAICGVVSQCGRQGGVKTPYCDTVIRIVKEAQQSGDVPTLDRLSDFANL